MAKSILSAVGPDHVYDTGILLKRLAGVHAVLKSAAPVMGWLNATHPTMDFGEVKVTVRAATYWNYLVAEQDWLLGRLRDLGVTEGLPERIA